MTSAQDDKYYLVSEKYIDKIKDLEKLLYRHDSKRISADESRDYANWLNQVFFERIEGPVTLDELGGLK